MAATEQGVWDLQNVRDKQLQSEWSYDGQSQGFVWGWNNTGNLGLNDTVQRSSPVQIDAVVRWWPFGDNVFQSKNYDADRIIRKSLELVKTNNGLLNAIIKRYFFYPLTKKLGLSFIQKQLQSGKWISYTLEGFKEELCQAGFDIGPSESVYAESAYLLCGHKSS